MLSGFQKAAVLTIAALNLAVTLPASAFTISDAEFDETVDKVLAFHAEAETLRNDAITAFDAGDRAAGCAALVKSLEDRKQSLSLVEELIEYAEETESEDLERFKTFRDNQTAAIATDAPSVAECLA